MSLEPTPSKPTTEPDCAHDQVPIAPESALDIASHLSMLLDIKDAHLLGTDYVNIVREYTWDALSATDSPLELRLEAALRLRSVVAPDEHGVLLNHIRNGSPAEQAGAAIGLSDSDEPQLRRSLYVYMHRLSRNWAEPAEFDHAGRSKLVELLDHGDTVVTTIAALNLRHYGSAPEKTAALDTLLYSSSAAPLDPHLRAVVTKAISSHWNEALSIPLDQQMVLLNLTGRSMPAIWQLASLTHDGDFHQIVNSLPLSPLGTTVGVRGCPEMVDLNNRVGEITRPVVVLGQRIVFSDSSRAGDLNAPSQSVYSRPLLVLERAAQGLDIETFPIQLAGKGACVGFFLKPPVFCTFMPLATSGQHPGSDELAIRGRSSEDRKNICLRMWRAP